MNATNAEAECTYGMTAATNLFQEVNAKKKKKKLKSACCN